MRVSPEQIKQGILHPAQEVRDASIFYFADSFSDDPTIMPLVIQAIEEPRTLELPRYTDFDEELSQTG
jgi:hypothetical protein